LLRSPLFERKENRMANREHDGSTPSQPGSGMGGDDRSMEDRTRGFGEEENVRGIGENEGDEEFEEAEDLEAEEDDEEEGSF
jgi:hypothetical protein